MNSIQILISDDMPQVRQDLSTALRLAGQAAGIPIDILGEAGDGCQAVEMALALQPDLILMDLEMPLLDGFSATRQIKAAYPAARILVLTVHDRTEDRAWALQAGADGFLVKGAPVTDIIQEINRIMRSNP
jgi:DNA-binding NarL/FixJ family response regulator